jgi:fumarate hydratase class II
MEFRIEKDTMGEVKVPAHRYWGAQTERSRNNFKIGPEGSMPIEIIHAFAYLKKAAAHANHLLGVLTQEKRDLISNVCDEILTGQHNDEFPLRRVQRPREEQSSLE